MKADKIKKIICAVLILTVVLSVGAVSYADHNKEKTNKAINEKRKSYEDLKVTLSKLVTEGKLKKETEDKILAYIQKRQAEKKEQSKNQDKNKCHKKGRLLEELKTAGIITKDEAEMIRVKYIQIKEEKLTANINGLIERKVITTKEAEQIKSFLKEKREERKKEFEKIREMTEDQRKEYFKTHKIKRKDIINEMVEKGVIKKEQAEEVRKALPVHHRVLTDKQ